MHIRDELTIEVDASAVSNLLLDVESHPKLFRTCLRVENLTPTKSLSPAEAGAKIRYKRVSIAGKIYRYTTRITVRNDSRRYYSMATTFMGCTSTKSYHVQPIINKTCSITVAHALVPDGLCGKTFLWLNRKRLQSGELHKTILCGLQDIKMAAETGKFNDEFLAMPPQQNNAIVGARLVKSSSLSMDHSKRTDDVDSSIHSLGGGSTTITTTKAI